MSGAAGAWVSGGASLGSLVQLLVSSRAERPAAILSTIWLACALAVAAMSALWLTNTVRWKGRPGSTNGSNSSSSSSSSSGAKCCVSSSSSSTAASSSCGTEASAVYKAIALQDMSHQHDLQV
jgi:cytoskeletal protein RodZ